MFDTEHPTKQKGVLNMNKRSISLLLAIALSNSAEAGLYGFTMHSRANCANNESISWHAGYARDLKTYSNHYKGGNVHEVITNREVTWRSAAVHWNEAYAGAGWLVVGEHWGNVNAGEGGAKKGSGYRHLKETIVNNCSIYDGWWD
jgi:hypothetical protein